MRWVNLPKKMALADYKEAVDSYVKKIFHLVDSVYQVGNVKSPGLSDIDLVVIPKKRFAIAERLELKPRLDCAHKSLAVHNPFVLVEPTHPAWRYVSLENSQKVYGQYIDFGSEDLSAHPSNKFCILIEGIAQYLVFIDSHLAKSEDLDAQKIIPVFNSARFTESIAYEFGLVEEMGHGMLMDQLRFEYLETGDERILDSMNSSFCSIVKLVAARITDVHGFSCRARDVRLLYENCRSGILVSDVFDSDFVCNRVDAVNDYLSKLKRAGFYYGSPFRPEVFGRAPVNLYTRVKRKFVHSMLY